MLQALTKVIQVNDIDERQLQGTFFMAIVMAWLDPRLAIPQILMNPDCRKDLSVPMPGSLAMEIWWPDYQVFSAGQVYKSIVSSSVKPNGLISVRVGLQIIALYCTA